MLKVFADARFRGLFLGERLHDVEECMPADLTTTTGIALQHIRASIELIVVVHTILVAIVCFFDKSARGSSR